MFDVAKLPIPKVRLVHIEILSVTNVASKVTFLQFVLNLAQNQELARSRDMLAAAVLARLARFEENIALYNLHSHIFLIHTYRNQATAHP